MASLRAQYSSLQEEVTASRKSDSDGLALQLAQFAEQTAQFAQHSQAWEQERVELVESHTQALAALHEENGLAIRSTRTALEETHAATVLELETRHNAALTEAHRDREAAQDERLRLEAELRANGEAAAKTLAEAEEKFEERLRLLGQSCVTCYYPSLLVPPLCLTFHI